LLACWFITRIYYWLLLYYYWFPSSCLGTLVSNKNLIISNSYIPKLELGNEQKPELGNEQKAGAWEQANL
jgi:hypothetical protein